MTTYSYMLPPANGPYSISFNGRTYTTTAGASMAVLDFDIMLLEANGWTLTNIAPIVLSDATDVPVEQSLDSGYLDQ